MTKKKRKKKSFLLKRMTLKEFPKSKRKKKYDELKF